jgi:hypothetical protein
MATRELAGEDAYLKKMQQTARSTQNRLPVVQGEVVNSDQTYQSDIYGKGAFFMHTLRYILGDEKFFPALKKLATDPRYTYDNTVTTADVEKLFSGVYGTSLKPLFQDKLEVHVKQTADDKYIVKLLNLDMTIPMDILTSSGIKRLMIDKKGVTVESKTALQIDPTVFYLKKVILE